MLYSGNIVISQVLSRISTFVVKKKQVFVLDIVNIAVSQIIFKILKIICCLIFTIVSSSFSIEVLVMEEVLSDLL